MTKQKILLFFISAFFAFLVGEGLYGYGHDFYAGYIEHNVDLENYYYRDRLGWMIATAAIFDVHIGVHLVSFILAASSGLILLRFAYQYFSSQYVWLFYILHVLIIHTWPIIMSTSNAMRQGIAMSLIFLGVYFFDSKRAILAYFFLLIAVYTHKSGFLFLAVLIITHLFDFLITRKDFSDNFRKSLFFIFGLLLFYMVYTLLQIEFPSGGSGRIIYGDFRYPFLLINLAYIFLYFIYLINRSNSLDRYLLWLSFIFPAFLLNEFNWEYERFNMMIIIFYLISFSSMFKFNQRGIILFAEFFLLFFMTILTGMYTSLK